MCQRCGVISCASEDTLSILCNRFKILPQELLDQLDYALHRTDLEKEIFFLNVLYLPVTTVH